MPPDVCRVPVNTLPRWPCRGPADRATWDRRDPDGRSLDGRTQRYSPSSGGGDSCRALPSPALNWNLACRRGSGASNQALDANETQRSLFPEMHSGARCPSENLDPRCGHAATRRAWASISRCVCARGTKHRGSGTPVLQPRETAHRCGQLQGCPRCTPCAVLTGVRAAGEWRQAVSGRGRNPGAGASVQTREAGLPPHPPAASRVVLPPLNFSLKTPNFSMCV